MYDSGSLGCLVQDSYAIKPVRPGMLSGMTFVVKDNIAISGHVSSFGNPRWRGTHRKSRKNAPVVDRILNGGGEIVGLAKLDEMTLSLVGNAPEGTPPINPLYPDRFTGGSSSGTASAVAGGIAQVGIGTDTAGSIRVPAACCGLYAIRPSHGMIDSSGVVPLAKSFDVVGIASMDPRLIRSTLLEVKSARKLPDTKVQRVVLPADALKTASKETGMAVRRAATAIAKAMGARLEEQSFGSFLDAKFSDLFTRIRGRETWKLHSAWVRQNHEYLFPDIRMRLEGAKKWSESAAEDAKADIHAREKYTQDLAEYLGDDALVALPVISGLAPKRTASEDELTEFRKSALSFTSPAGLSGFPETVVPARAGKKGFVYGVGLLGPRNSDMALLDAAIAASKARV